MAGVLIGLLISFLFVEEIPQIDRYFPDTIGYQWKYRGTITRVKGQQVATYSNSMIIKGTTRVKGVTVTVVQESNSANQGRRDSYFQKDSTGLLFYGSRPPSPVEEGLVPYHLIPFPWRLQSPFLQVEKKGISYRADLDGDGENEEADVTAHVVAVTFESVAVPVGIFPQALRIEGVMTLSIRLSHTGKAIRARERVTQWFMEGVGPVKSLVTSRFPSPDDQPDSVTIVTEELEEHTGQGEKQ